ncbi:MAG: ABC transporter ATP-binding protein [Rhodospirillales bacterium]|nr:ABC transporter ATP-binding protein [Rhodospirillales bacterium]
MDHVIHAYEDDPPVVRDVSFDVKPGELVCLLGPSGCGKTTLLRLAAGLEIVQQGQISIGDKTVGLGETGHHMPPEVRGVGLMFQDYALFPHLTILENVTFGLTDSNGARYAWARDSLSRIGLGGTINVYPHTLSGGQQQRVALLRALATEPRVLLLDEPFSGMDVTLRANVREQTLTILKETGVATLMVTHDPEEAMFMADRILVMQGGRIIQAGTPQETYFHPANPFVAALFGPINELSGTVQDKAVKTPLGDFETPAMADGTEARIFIRPEGLKMEYSGEPLPDDAGEGYTARVVSARMLGRSSHLRLSFAADAYGTEIDIQARIPGAFLPASGSTITVWVDPNQVFVFPV